MATGTLACKCSTQHSPLSNAFVTVARWLHQMHALGKSSRLAAGKPFTAAARTFCAPVRRQVQRSHSVMASAIKDKTVVVTGGNRGIGLELAKQLLSKGNKVLVAARTPTAELEQLSQQSNGQLTAMTGVDVSSPESIAAFADKAKAATGGRVDVLINNAGYLSPWAGLDAVSAEEMIESYKINTIGPLLVVKELRDRGLLGKGSLVANVTSKVGSVEDNSSGGGYPYRASKAALNIVNKSLSIDLQSEGITCVLLHPGWVQTRMTKGAGLIDAKTSAAGLIAVLESNRPLNGRFYAFDGKEIPW